LRLPSSIAAFLLRGILALAGGAHAKPAANPLAGSHMFRHLRGSALAEFRAMLIGVGTFVANRPGLAGAVLAFVMVSDFGFVFIFCFFFIFFNCFCFFF